MSCWGRWDASHACSPTCPHPLVSCASHRLATCAAAPDVVSALTDLYGHVHEGLALLFSVRVQVVAAAGEGAVRDGKARRPHRSEPHLASAALPAQMMHAAAAPALISVIAGPPMLQSLCHDASRGHVVVSLLLQVVRDVFFSASAGVGGSSAAVGGEQLASSSVVFVLRCGLLAATAARLLSQNRTTGDFAMDAGASGKALGHASMLAMLHRSLESGGSRLHDGRAGDPMARNRGRRGPGLWGGRGQAGGIFADGFGAGDAMTEFVEDDLHGGIFGAGDDGDEGLDEARLLSLQGAVPMQMDDMLRRVGAGYASLVVSGHASLDGVPTPAAIAADVVATFQAGGLALTSLPFRFFAETCVTFAHLASVARLPAGMPQNGSTSGASARQASGGTRDGCQQLVSVYRVLMLALRIVPPDMRSNVVVSFASEYK